MAPTQLEAPSAVTIAVAILAIICTINLIVSFLVIIQIFTFSHFFHFYIGRVGWGLSPKP